ncbi:MAG: GNAT family N-acetyltransferase [Chitinophagales bacterium]
MAKSCWLSNQEKLSELETETDFIKGIRLFFKDLFRSGKPKKFTIAEEKQIVALGNIGSEKLLTKLSFQKEGILRQWMHWNENYYDITMFSLLKEERKRKVSKG